eukprot:10901888-Heterocapsa_arctica.AAC.1
MRNGFGVQDASQKLKDDGKVVMEAIMNKGSALQCATNELNETKHRRSARTGRKGYHSALQRAAEELKGD